MTVDWEGVLSTYRCLLSCRKKMPGMCLEDAFNKSAVDDIEREYVQLSELAREQGYVEEGDDA
jgi:hypothetical protein